MWFKKRKKTINYSLTYIIDTIFVNLSDLKNVRFHLIFNGNVEILSDAVKAIELSDYKHLLKMPQADWNTNNTFLVSCEFKFEKRLILISEPYEYLYDTSKIIYNEEISDLNFDDLLATLPAFSTYKFDESTLMEAFSKEGDDLFKWYDFSSINVQNKFSVRK